MKPIEVVLKLLSNATDLGVCKELIAEDATYVSLNYHHPDLTAIEPWCGTHLNEGPAAVHKTFVDVDRFWTTEAFEIYTIFSDTTADPSTTWSPPEPKPTPDGGNSPDTVNVAVFDRFRYRSRTLNQISDSPFCVWAKVDERKGKVIYMQFMEDTLNSATSFRKSGMMVYVSDPNGKGEVVIGSE